MQKVIRRTIMAEKQVARRYAKRSEQNRRDARRETQRQAIFRGRQMKALIQGEQIARREDWEMGNLAPKRDVGINKDVYGTLDPLLLQGPELTAKARRELEDEIKDKYQALVKGDRVILLEGRDKGKVGTILEKLVSRGQVTVKGLNMAEVAMSEHMRQNLSGDEIVRDYEQPIPIRSVRLVHRVGGTQQRKDMIINKLVRHQPRIFMKKEGEWHYKPWVRLVPGTNITVPWPVREKPETPEPQPIDTLRIDVETRTFVPTLLRPPMPTTVIDELRNKYSIFRTRHDAEYIERKMAEDREVAAKKAMVKQMTTPMHEIRRKERRLRRLEKNGTLTESMMNRIGKMIAEKKQLLLDETVTRPAAQSQLAI